ncbi:hypothetical protein PENTCL1PPCAC_13879 [Pristionchus entomophagus]|uniref:G protein-coupled receptor n=1 Tax=Pristionchus entomophagus TaxID=358040 RepID=A0AAV5T9T7_9BILA|nr:hypothetical protein PENTCL1PPCAC_13877 [Pristionchus entomophagus]GMS91704.1 hypothetical protein PENTCL1PPCAC_13879 [Pristionchus entomophagus]
MATSFLIFLHFSTLHQCFFVLPLIISSLSLIVFIQSISYPSLCLCIDLRLVIITSPSHIHWSTRFLIHKCLVRIIKLGTLRITVRRVVIPEEVLFLQ